MFFFQAEDGIRALVRSRGLGDVYKRQVLPRPSLEFVAYAKNEGFVDFLPSWGGLRIQSKVCLLYTSDAADDLLCVDLGGRRLLKKKKTTKNS